MLELMRKEISAGIARGLGFAVMLAILDIALLAFSGMWSAGTTTAGPRDSSDPAGEQSRVWVRTDALTGLQYLEGDKGGLTPRLKRDGMHMTREDVSRLLQETGE